MKKNIGENKKLNKLVLNDKELRECIGMSRVNIWRLEKEGKFPKRRYLSKGRVCWLVSEVETWIKELPTEI